jgi:hypothetical protein
LLEKIIEFFSYKLIGYLLIVCNHHFHKEFSNPLHMIIMVEIIRLRLDNHARNKLSENLLWMIMLYSRYNDRNVDEGKDN